MRQLYGLDCDGVDCPLGHRLDCIPSEGNFPNERRNVAVLFVGRAPGETEIQRGRRRPFVGAAGALLRRAIRHVCGQQPWAVTNAVRCRPVDRRALDEARERCAGFLRQDVERFDPDVVVLLGNTTLPDVKRCERGEWLDVELSGRRRAVLSTWDPAYVGRNKNLLPMFFQDVELAFRLAGGWRPDPAWALRGRSRLLLTVQDVEAAVQDIRRQPGYCAVDVETRNLNKRYGNEIALIQFAWTPDQAVCVALRHPQNPMAPADIERCVALLRGLFREPIGLRGWLAHFGKFEQTQIGRDLLDGGTIHNAPMIDTGAFAYLLDENASNLPGSYALKRLARTLLRFHHYDDETLALRAAGSLMDLPLWCRAEPGQDGWEPNLVDYGGMDAYVTFRLYRALCLEADRQHYLKQSQRLLRHLFSPVYRLLSRIERNGFWANREFLNELRDPRRSPIIRRLREIDHEVVPGFESAARVNAQIIARQGSGPALFGDPWLLDLQRDAHVRAWLIDELGLRPLRHGKSGEPSVDRACLVQHQDRPEVRVVLERRGLAKLASAYINQLVGYLDPRHQHRRAEDQARQLDCRDGRIRCDIHFTSTTTGRGSASNPNMQQQVRANTPAKAALKSIFQAEQPGLQASFNLDLARGPPPPRPTGPPHNCLVQLDFRSNEYRWWAVMSGCPDLARAFNDGKVALDAFRQDPTPQRAQAARLSGDIHLQVASLMFDRPVEDVDKEMRHGAKSIGFGAIYGRGIRALAQQLQKSEDEAQKLIDKFSGAFPVGWDWIHRQPDVARRHRYVESPIGRRRRLPHYFVLRPDHEMSRDDRRLINECDRMAMNSPIQGIASDASFIGTALFADHIERCELTWLVQNVVHDSCIYQVPIQELRGSIEVAERIFTTDTMRYMTRHWGVEFNCPIEVEFEIGLRWGELKTWDFTESTLNAMTKEMANV